VRRWLKRYQAEGVDGLRGQHCGGHPATVTDTDREQVLSAVRRHPRSLGQPYALWILQRLADYLIGGAQRVPIRRSARTHQLCQTLAQEAALDAVLAERQGAAITLGGLVVPAGAAQQIGAG